MFPRTAPISALQTTPSRCNYRELARGTSIPTTSLLNAAPAGMYRVFGYVATQTPGAGNVTITVGFTDSIGAKTAAFLAPLSFNAGEYSSSDKIIEVAKGDITFSTTYAASGKYNIFVALERLI